MSGNSWTFIHNPDDFASCFQTQANTIIKFVHENYLNTMGSNMDGAERAIDAISLADFLNSEWRVRIINFITFEWNIWSSAKYLIYQFA